MIEHIEQGTLPPGKKACIALTSWRRRINTVGLTIFNLMCVCGPEFHIVLTLAEEEFPRKERELPRDLVRMNNAGLFEILWVKQNYKAMKKWVFASRKYAHSPVISADDDCLYTCNYAQILYNALRKHNSVAFVKYIESKFLYMPIGPCTIYHENLGQYIPVEIMPRDYWTNDDAYFETFFKNNKLSGMQLPNKIPYIFHTKVGALNPEQYDD